MRNGMAPGYHHRNLPETRRGIRGRYPEHDDFEGLPVRQWRKKLVKVKTPSAIPPKEEDPKWASELPHGQSLPKDFDLLPPHSQELLRAARAGRLKPAPPPPPPKKLGGKEPPNIQALIVAARSRIPHKRQILPPDIGEDGKEIHWWEAAKKRKEAAKKRKKEVRDAKKAAEKAARDGADKDAEKDGEKDIAATPTKKRKKDTEREALGRPAKKLKRDSIKDTEKEVAKDTAQDGDKDAEKDTGDGAGEDGEEDVDKDSKKKKGKKVKPPTVPGKFTVAQWELVPRNKEGSTISLLAKRRKNTITLTPKAVLAANTGPTITRAKVRRTDAAGNSYEETVVLQEGEEIDGDIISTTTVAVSTAPLTSGGTGANRPPPSPVKKKPKPPKPRKKGPWQRRKKKGGLPLPAPASAPLGGSTLATAPVVSSPLVTAPVVTATEVVLTEVTTTEAIASEIQDVTKIATIQTTDMAVSPPAQVRDLESDSGDNDEREGQEGQESNSSFQDVDMPDSDAAQVLIENQQPGGQVQAQEQAPQEDGQGQEQAHHGSEGNQTSAPLDQAPAFEATQQDPLVPVTDDTGSSRRQPHPTGPIALTAHFPVLHHLTSPPLESSPLRNMVLMSPTDPSPALSPVVETFNAPIQPQEAPGSQEDTPMEMDSGGTPAISDTFLDITTTFSDFNDAPIAADNLELGGALSDMDFAPLGGHGDELGQMASNELPAGAARVLDGVGSPSQALLDSPALVSAPVPDTDDLSDLMHGVESDANQFLSNDGDGSTAERVALLSHDEPRSDEEPQDGVGQEARQPVSEVSDETRRPGSDGGQDNSQAPGEPSQAPQPISGDNSESERPARESAEELLEPLREIRDDADSDHPPPTWNSPPDGNFVAPPEAGPSSGSLNGLPDIPSSLGPTVPGSGGARLPNAPHVPNGTYRRLAPGVTIGEGGDDNPDPSPDNELVSGESPQPVADGAGGEAQEAALDEYLINGGWDTDHDRFMRTAPNGVEHHEDEQPESPGGEV